MATEVVRLLRRSHTTPQPVMPAWATEDTAEVEALRRTNNRLQWATESTGLLMVLRSGLESLDQVPGEQREEVGMLGVSRRKLALVALSGVVWLALLLTLGWATGAFGATPDSGLIPVDVPVVCRDISG